MNGIQCLGNLVVDTKVMLQQILGKLLVGDVY
jgi:hypothetical protein